LAESLTSHMLAWQGWAHARAAAERFIRLAESAGVRGLSAVDHGFTAVVVTRDPVAIRREFGTESQQPDRWAAPILMSMRGAS
jgi:hypothetical protein